ncbi:MAG: hypothetical protein ACF8LL_12830, partial [Phycisphaerales bacterium]
MRHPLPRRILTVFIVTLVCSSWAMPARAQDADNEHDFIVYPDDASITYHTVTINGEPVSYQAVAGTLTLAQLRGKHDPTASMFYMAYRKVESIPEEGEEPVFPDAAQRPITFSFNGGPGSSSVWLHLGVYGPKRVNPVDEFGNPGPPPYSVVDNEYSMLDKSDFVFIDPVSTGYSRPAEDKSEKDFHGLREDINSVAEFIRIYLGRTGRWGSPKYITGESYGTTRAAGLVDELQDTHGIAINGTILVSAIMNFGTA